MQGILPTRYYQVESGSATHRPEINQPDVVNFSAPQIRIAKVFNGVHHWRRQIDAVVGANKPQIKGGRAVIVLADIYSRTQSGIIYLKFCLSFQSCPSSQGT